MKFSEYESIIEAVLFASGEAMPLKQIAAAIETDEKTARSIVKNLSDKYKSEERGFCIIELDSFFQMCTNPKYYGTLKKIYGANPEKTLSGTLLETLAIVAYLQPVTKAQIEEIRGVNADHAVNRLMEYNLVAEAGRADTPGRPLILATTKEFLKLYGLSSINQLPALTNDFERLRKQAQDELFE